MQRRALGSWLRKMGHEHSVTLSRFGLNFVGGEWRSDTKKWDAGVFVMLLMATYQGNAENLTQHALLKVNEIRPLALLTSFKCICSTCILSRTSIEQQ